MPLGFAFMDNIAAVPVTETPQIVTPSVPIEQAPVVAETPNENVFSLYEQSAGLPYTAKFFGMTRSQFEALKMADIDDTGAKLAQIEAHIRNSIQQSQYVDSTKTAEQILSEWITQLGIKEYETPSSKVHKLFLFINNGQPMNRQFQVKRTSKADELDHAKNQAYKDLVQRYPNKTRKLGSIFSSFTK